MKSLPRISEAEWLVMKLLWNRSPQSAAEIVQQLATSENWHPKTIKTLLNRLLKKKAIGFQKERRAYLYYPLVLESECVAAVSQSFLDRVFGGALQPMLAHFVEQQKISPAKMKALQQILETDD